MLATETSESLPAEIPLLAEATRQEELNSWTDCTRWSGLDEPELKGSPGDATLAGPPFADPHQTLPQAVTLSFSEGQVSSRRHSRRPAITMNEPTFLGCDLRHHP